jgi:deoxyribodipyrimidine photolyase
VKEIHFPAPLERQGGYPLPIVDHAEARARALKRYGGGA